MSQKILYYYYTIISPNSTGKILNLPCRVSSDISRVSLALNRSFNSLKSPRAKVALFSLQVLKVFDSVVLFRSPLQPTPVTSTASLKTQTSRRRMTTPDGIMIFSQAHIQTPKPGTLQLAVRSLLTRLNKDEFHVPFG